MKLIFILFIAFLFNQKDIYFVSHIKGSVMFAGTNKALKVGDRISLQDSLVFLDKNDLVAIISPSRGRFVILPEHPIPHHKPSEFWLAVNDNYVPAIKINTLATRGGLLNSLADIEQYLKSFSLNDSSRMLMIDYINIPLSQSFFDNKAKDFFFLRYQYHGDTINKKLRILEPKSGNTPFYLTLNKDIYTVDGKPIEPGLVDEASLFYYKPADNESIELGQFRLRFITQKTLMPELDILVQSLSELYKNEENKISLIADEVTSHLDEYYGKPDKERILELLNKR